MRMLLWGWGRRGRSESKVRGERGGEGRIGNEEQDFQGGGNEIGKKNLQHFYNILK